MAALNIFQPSDVDVGQHIGPSDTSNVFLAKVKSTGNVVAVKNVTHTQQRELNILKSLQHENIIRLLGTIDSVAGGALVIGLVLEYAPNGNLYDYLNSATEFLPDYLTWCKQAVSAIEYIHEQDVSHRDIKSLNYLVFGDIIKLSDFGLSKNKLNITKTSKNDIKGTFLWMSPEVMGEKDNVDHFKSDIYSLGIVLWELYHREEPYSGWKLTGLMNHVVSGKGHLKIEDECDSGLHNLLINCWEYEPSKRPTAEEILTSLNNKTPLVRDSSGEKTKQSRSDMAVYGYWLAAFAFVVIGLVLFNYPAGLVDLTKLWSIKEITTPAKHTESVTVQPIVPPTTVSPATTAPPRNWQKEGHTQIMTVSIHDNLKDRRSGTVKVYGREFRYDSEMEWFRYYSTATDSATAIEAVAGGYQSRGGANEHAIENLINKLKAANIIKD